MTDFTRKPLLRDQAYDRLKELILNGTIPPGTFLSERQLSDQLGMSKTPIRTALERLEIDGLVSISPRQGILVRELPLQEIFDHYDMRIALETFVVRQIAGRLSASQIDTLRANLAVQEETISQGDVEHHIQADIAFHMLLCEFLENREIIRVLEHQRAILHRVIAHHYERNLGRMPVSYAEHQEIVTALVAGDGEQSARTMETHLRTGKQLLIS